MIESTKFGQITIDGSTYDHDIVTLPSGDVIKRKKKLSKKEHGTSHIVSVNEIKAYFEKGTETFIAGTGQYGILELSHEAKAYLEKKGVRIQTAPTPEAIKIFNKTKGVKIALFHVTC